MGIIVKPSIFVYIKPPFKGGIPQIKKNYGRHEAGLIGLSFA